MSSSTISNNTKTSKPLLNQPSAYILQTDHVTLKQVEDTFNSLNALDQQTAIDAYRRNKKITVDVAKAMKHKYGKDWESASESDRLNLMNQVLNDPRKIFHLTNYVCGLIYFKIHPERQVPKDTKKISNNNNDDDSTESSDSSEESAGKNSVVLNKTDTKKVSTTTTTSVSNPSPFAKYTQPAVQSTPLVFGASQSKMMSTSTAFQPSQSLFSAPSNNAQSTQPFTFGAPMNNVQPVFGAQTNQPFSFSAPMNTAQSITPQQQEMRYVLGAEQRPSSSPVKTVQFEDDIQKAIRLSKESKALEDSELQIALRESLEDQEDEATKIAKLESELEQLKLKARKNKNSNNSEMVVVNTHKSRNDRSYQHDSELIPLSTEIQTQFPPRSNVRIPKDATVVFGNSYNGCTFINNTYTSEKPNNSHFPDATTRTPVQKGMISQKMLFPR